jgi:hypothetical protein
VAEWSNDRIAIFFDLLIVLTGFANNVQEQRQAAAERGDTTLGLYVQPDL